jgi:hypothetical protein
MRYSQIRQGVITHAAGSKTALSDTDEFAVSDSQDSNILKKVTWALINSAVATLRNKTLLGAKADIFYNVNGSKVVELWTEPNGVNHLGINPGVAGAGPALLADGPDTNIGISITAKNRGGISVRSNSNGPMLTAAAVAGATNAANNYINVTNAAAGGTPYFAARGTDANINMEFYGYGTGTVRVGTAQIETKGHTHTVAQVTGARSWAAVPANAAAPGTPGMEAYDADWHYVCVFTNTWKRTPLTTWT